VQGGPVLLEKGYWAGGKPSFSWAGRGAPAEGFLRSPEFKRYTMCQVAQWREELVSPWTALAPGLCPGSPKYSIVSRPWAAAGTRCL